MAQYVIYKYEFVSIGTRYIPMIIIRSRGGVTARARVVETGK